MHACTLHWKAEVDWGEGCSRACSLNFSLWWVWLLSLPKFFFCSFLLVIICKKFHSTLVHFFFCIRLVVVALFAIDAFMVLFGRLDEDAVYATRLWLVSIFCNPHVQALLLYVVAFKLQWLAFHHYHFDQKYHHHYPSLSLYIYTHTHTYTSYHFFFWCVYFFFSFG